MFMAVTEITILTLSSKGLSHPNYLKWWKLWSNFFCELFKITPFFDSFEINQSKKV